MEEQLLGALLRYPSEVELSLRAICERDFTTPRNQIVYSAIAALHASGTSIDLVSVAEHLNARGEVDQIGGFDRLGELWEAACDKQEIFPVAIGMRMKRALH